MAQIATVAHGKHGSVTQQAYEYLKDLILVNELVPGTELRESALAETTGFGRTPVREALKRLVQQGLVEVRPRQGYRVTLVSLASVRDLFEMRMLLEPTAAALAAQRATRDDLEALGELARRTYSGDLHSYQHFLQDNREFHVAIARAAGNEILARSVQELHEGMQRLFFLSHGKQEQATEQLHEHHELYDALLERAAEKARAIVVDQIESSRTQVLEALINPGSRTVANVDRGSLISIDGR